MIHIKVGASTPDTKITLMRPDDPAAPLPLAGATITLWGRHRLTGDEIAKALTVIDPAASEVLVDWSAEETATLTPGEYAAEIWVEYDDGEVLILPAEGHYDLTVEASLGS